MEPRENSDLDLVELVLNDPFLSLTEALRDVEARRELREKNAREKDREKIRVPLLTP